MKQPKQYRFFSELQREYLKPSERALVDAQETEINRMIDLLQPVRLRAQIRANRARQLERDRRRAGDPLARAVQP